MNRVAAGALWLGVGLLKMAALVSLIDGHGLRAAMSLIGAWTLAGAALWLLRRPHLDCRPGDQQPCDMLN